MSDCGQWGAGMQRERAKLPLARPGTERWVMERLRENGGKRVTRMHLAQCDFDFLLNQLSFPAKRAIDVYGPHGLVSVVAVSGLKHGECDFA